MKTREHPAAVEMSAPDGRYPLGVALLLMAGLCFSFGGLFIRQMEAADGWQILFYRSVGATSMLLLFLAVRYRGQLLRPFLGIGRDGVIVAVAMATSTPGYIFALINAPVADVMFVIATAPVFSAVAGWLILGERVARASWAAIGVALGGMLVMFWHGAGGQGITGKLIALGIVLAFVAMIVALRSSKARDLMPASCLGIALTAPLSAVMADSLAVTPHDLALCLLLGVAQLGAAFLFISVGSRFVPAAQVSLLLLTEPILAPVWVWAFIDEVPRATTVAGGALVLGAVAAQSIIGIRSERRAAARARRQAA